jgi:hypothetical protein
MIGPIFSPIYTLCICFYVVYLVIHNTVCVVVVFFSTVAENGLVGTSFFFLFFSFPTTVSMDLRGVSF